jgi:hypothetical protein
MVKDDCIKVFKENNVYQVIYNAPKDIKPEIKDYIPEWLDKTDFNYYLVNNKLDLNYQDPESGNTIYHEVLSESGFDTKNYGNIDKVKKLIETSTNNYSIKNNDDKTPIECIKDVKVATLVINDLNNKLISLEKKLEMFEIRMKDLENKDEIADCSILNFISIKLYHLIENNWGHISLILTAIIFYLMIKLIF